jgi:hypothetical protein
MAKDIGAPKTDSIEELRARVQQRYEAVPFEHPNYPDIAFQLAILNNGEKEHISSVAAIDGPQRSGWAFNRMTVAYGLVSPELVPPPAPGATRQAREARAIRIADALRDYPDDFILPIADEIWRLTNEYRESREGGADSPPFVKRSAPTSSSSTSSSTAPESAPTLLKVGGKSG